MSKQMTCDWIENEYNKWKRPSFGNPFGVEELAEHTAKAFALHILIKASSKETNGK